MPDASIFSHEYRRASTLSDILNRGVLALKKHARDVPLKMGEKAHQRRLQATLALILDRLAEKLAAPREAQDDPEDPSGPLLRVELVNRLRADRGGDLPYFLTDLRHAAAALQQGGLDDATLRTLEAVAAAADVDASRVFRRMIRSR